MHDDNTCVQGQCYVHDDNDGTCIEMSDVSGIITRQHTAIYSTNANLDNCLTEDNGIAIEHSHAIEMHDATTSGQQGDLTLGSSANTIITSHEPVDNTIQPAHFNESCMVNQNYVEPDIPIEQLLAQQNSAPQLRFPHMAAQPVNMFQEENLEEKAFPTLFPRGRYGLDYPRTKPLTDLKYFQSRLFNKDARWCNNIVWIFWALNTFEMRKLQNEISIVSRIKKQNCQPLTVETLHNLLVIL